MGVSGNRTKVRPMKVQLFTLPSEPWLLFLYITFIVALSFLQLLTKVRHRATAKTALTYGVAR